MVTIPGFSVYFCNVETGREKMKELVIKLYEDKPSRVGIHYSSGFQAVKEYAALVDKFRGESLRARIEINKNRMNLILRSSESNDKMEYKDLTFNSIQLKRLQLFLKPDTELHFVHIYSKANQLFIAKPGFNKKMEFVTIGKFELNVRGEFME
jgi:hypothetical protein